MLLRVAKSARLMDWDGVSVSTFPKQKMSRQRCPVSHIVKLYKDICIKYHKV